MKAHVTEDFAHFDRVARSFIESDPVRHTVHVSILQQLRIGAGYGDVTPWFAWAEDDAGAVVGAAVRTPPHLVVVTPMPLDAARALGERLSDRELPGATGDVDTVTALASGAGLRSTVHRPELQYVLHRLVEPPHPGGSAEPYREDDEDLVLAWIRDFNHEVDMTVQRDARDALRGRLATGATVWLWWVDGQAVSMAGAGAPASVVPRIGPVWTPPEHRRRGYAAAVTAHACRELLAAGVPAITLFTEVSNPTSNAIYQRLGFEPVGSVAEALFDSPASG